MNRVGVAAATATTVTVVALAEPGPAGRARACPRPPALPTTFVRRVDNEYLPLRAGTTFTFRGRQDGKPAKDVVTVARRAKTTLGIPVTVVAGSPSRRARRNLHARGTPRVGRTLKQEDAKNVAEDCSRIVDLKADARTPFVSSRRALETEEFSLLERGVLDHKFYVRGIGLVKEQTVQAGTTCSSSSR